MSRLTDPLNVYSPGPAVLPRDALIAALEGQPARPTVKIPVVVCRQPGSHRIKQVFIGVCADMEPADRVLLHPDDTMLGIGLSDRLSRVFGMQPICHIWLIGRWGPRQEHGFGLSPPPGSHPFTVHTLQVRSDGPTKNEDACILVSRSFVR